jgi:Zn ribbon nucleic-acid-binding protein
MKIQSITSQDRRDFFAVYECEHCGAIKKGRGYDDDYFHRHIIPAMECTKCGKSAPEDYRPMGTRYAAHEIV